MQCMVGLSRPACMYIYMSGQKDNHSVSMLMGIKWVSILRLMYLVFFYFNQFHMHVTVNTKLPTTVLQSSSGQTHDMGMLINQETLTTEERCTYIP